MPRLKATMVPLLLLAACGPAADDEQPTAAAAAAPVVEAPAAPEVRRVLASSRIYYDLTRFEWYARGEPLVHEQLAYQPVGTPQSAELDEVEQAGAYQGVEYYRRRGDDQSLYVPVDNGYWLVFRAVAPTLRAD